MEMNTDTINALGQEIGSDNLPMLLDIFTNELQQYILQLTQASETNGAVSQFQEICHALKSSAASFGAEDLCQLSTAVDNEVKDGLYSHDSKRVDRFVLVLQRTLSCYQQFIASFTF